MLQKIRDRISGWFAAVFLGAIAVVFIFWGIQFESSLTTAAATVNGEDIPAPVIRQAWQDRQTELQQAVRDELPPEVIKTEQEKLLDDYITRELLVQRANESGYRVSDRELAEAIQKIPSLQVDGVFSRDRYAALLRQQGRTEPDFEREFRRDLETSQLQNAIAISGFVTPGELLRRVELEAETREVAYAVVPAARFAGEAAADAGRRRRVLRPEQVAVHDAGDAVAAVPAGQPGGHRRRRAGDGRRAAAVLRRDRGRPQRGARAPPRQPHPGRKPAAIRPRRRRKPRRCSHGRRRARILPSLRARIRTIRVRRMPVATWAGRRGRPTSRSSRTRCSRCPRARSAGRCRPSSASTSCGSTTSSSRTCARSTKSARNSSPSSGASRRRARSTRSRSCWRTRPSPR